MINSWIAIKKQIQNMKKVITILTVLIILFSFSSCKKVEGPGGKASITGKVHALIHDGAGNLINEYDIEKYDVFIIYGGENTYFDDDVKTSFDGTFRFDYLEVGDYQVFLYEDCASCNSGKEVILLNVEITDKKGTIDLGTINVEK